MDWPYDHPTRGTCVPECPMYGTCHCGCGEATSVARQNDRHRQVARGHHYIFRHSHSLVSRAIWRSMAGNPANWHTYEVPLERVRPLAEFLWHRYGLEKGADVAGIHFSTLYAVLTARQGKRAVRNQTARKIVNAVLAHRKPGDPLSVFDMSVCRLPSTAEKAESR